MTPLLLHSEAVPVEARVALRAAALAPPESRTSQLELAARALYHATDLDCREARDLVGLPSHGACG